MLTEDPDEIVLDEPAPRQRKRPRRLIPAANTRKGRVVRWVFFGLSAFLTVLVLAVAISIVGALRTPGNESFKAKWADWLRDHNGDSVVNVLEEVYFKQNAPPVGGAPKHGVEQVQAPSGAPGTPGSSAPPAGVAHLPVPGPVKLVTRGIHGEGDWQATGPLVNGLPGMYVTQVRPDRIHTSVLVSLVWIDTKLFRLSLMPGTTEPGQKFPTPSFIDQSSLPTVAAAFNGGFRFRDAKGGFYLDGREAVPLRQGAASLVAYKDGTINVGQWGRDVNMRADVHGVLQNLVLLVDHGQVVPGLNPSDTKVWGNTLKGSVLVPRSGVCVDANGGVVYIAGPGLTITTMADTMARAGCVRGMELDINPEWVTFNFFDHKDPAHPNLVVGRKLYPELYRSATRYLKPDSRDFIMINSRS